MADTLSADLLLGTRLGGFGLVERLGRGGMGWVYRAHDVGLDRWVAVKVLPPEYARDVSSVNRFLREARTLARLRHPNLAAIHAVGEESGWRYFVMELIEGRSIAASLAADGPMGWAGALDVAGQVLSALAAAHAVGIIHRDVKAANVMRDAAGRVVLVDFGLARPENDQGLTEHGVWVGTPDYMAPEQAEGQVDARSDLYALGILWYEMLAGHTPFHRPTWMQTLRAKVEAPPPDWRAACPEAPEAFADIGRRLLSPDPAGRPASSVALARELLTLADTPALRATAAMRPTEDWLAPTLTGSADAVRAPTSVAAATRAKPVTEALNREAADPASARATADGVVPDESPLMPKALARTPFPGSARASGGSAGDDTAVMRRRDGPAPEGEDSAFGLPMLPTFAVPSSITDSVRMSMPPTVSREVQERPTETGPRAGMGQASRAAPSGSAVSAMSGSDAAVAEGAWARQVASMPPAPPFPGLPRPAASTESTQAMSPTRSASPESATTQAAGRMSDVVALARKRRRQRAFWARVSAIVTGLGIGLAMGVCAMWLMTRFDPSGPPRNGPLPEDTGRPAGGGFPPRGAGGDGSRGGRPGGGGQASSMGGRPGEGGFRRPTAREWNAFIQGWGGGAGGPPWGSLEAERALQTDQAYHSYMERRPHAEDLDGDAFFEQALSEADALVEQWRKRSVLLERVRALSPRHVNDTHANPRLLLDADQYPYVLLAQEASLAFMTPGTSTPSTEGDADASSAPRRPRSIRSFWEDYWNQYDKTLSSATGLSASETARARKRLATIQERLAAPREPAEASP